MIPEFEVEKADQLLLKDTEAYHDIIDLATGFLKCSSYACSQGFYNNAVFFLHQAVEHACRALIRLFTGYRSDIHNLDWLIAFCNTFSGGPAASFRLRFDREKRLFRTLCRSYTESMYYDKFKVEKTDAENLYALIREFFDIASTLASNEFRSRAVKSIHATSVNEPLDYSPALPASLSR